MIWEDKKYTTGDIARLYGMTLDAVRFYEKKGLLLPDDKRDTKYRVYSRGDLSSMWQILRMKKIGVPLAEIRDIVNGYSAEQTDSLFQKHIEVLGENIQKLQRQYLWATVYREILDELKRNKGKFTVEESTVFAGKDVKPGIDHAEAWFQDNFGDVPTDLVTAWKREMPNSHSEEFDKNAFLEAIRTSAVQVYLAMKCSAEDIKDRDPDFIWPAQTCIHTVLATNYDEPDFSPILEYAEQHNYRSTGHIMARLVFREQAENGFTDYCEIWYAVE